MASQTGHDLRLILTNYAPGIHYEPQALRLVQADAPLCRASPGVAALALLVSPPLHQERFCQGCLGSLLLCRRAHGVSQEGIGAGPGGQPRHLLDPLMQQGGLEPNRHFVKETICC